MAVPVPVSGWPKPSQSSRIRTPGAVRSTTAYCRPSTPSVEAITTTQSAKMEPVV